MLAMLVVILICLFNTALGFVLAVHFGHGPPWTTYPRLDQIRRKLRGALGMDRQPRA